MAGTISRSEFDNKLEAGKLTLTLVGMSNMGKSHWSTRLVEEKNFSVIGCDDLIEAELGTVLQEAGFKSGITDMARWMGQPYEPQSLANQRRYLELEREVLEQTIHQITQPSLHSNIVIDTTGSVVHTNGEICNLLAHNSTVVYLEATPAQQHKMFEQYITEPKPVVWGDMYRQDPGESQSDALANCYPKLLAHRTKLYEQMAAITISRDDALALPSADDFLKFIRNRLTA